MRACSDGCTDRQVKRRWKGRDTTRWRVCVRTCCLWLRRLALWFLRRRARRPVFSFCMGRTRALGAPGARGWHNVSARRGGGYTVEVVKAGRRWHLGVYDDPLLAAINHQANPLGFDQALVL